MNKSFLSGRWTADPEIRYTQSSEPLCIASGTIAVDRRHKREGEPDADFIRVKAFGKTAEHIEKYYRKGMKALVTGRIQTGSYNDNDGKKVYTTEVVIEEIEFGEKKGDSSAPSTPAKAPEIPANGEFMSIPEGIDDELPFA